MSITAAGLTPAVRTRPCHSRVGVGLALLALTVGLAGGTAPVAHADAAGSDVTPVEASFLTRIASARANHDLPAYRVGRTITEVAREQARRMAARGTLFHNPDLTSDVPNWQFVGENVGFGPDSVTLHRAFMDSAPHRANILDKDFTRIGVGAVVRDGRVWVAEVFKTPQD